MTRTFYCRGLRLRNTQLCEEDLADSFQSMESNMSSHIQCHLSQSTHSQTSHQQQNTPRLTHHNLCLNPRFLLSPVWWSGKYAGKSPRQTFWDKIQFGINLGQRSQDFLLFLPWNVFTRFTISATLFCYPYNNNQTIWGKNHNVLILQLRNMHGFCLWWLQVLVARFVVSWHNTLSS